MKLKFPCAACLAAIVIAAPLQGSASNNDALYGAAIPDDAVFVRWLEPTKAPEVFGVSFDPAVSENPNYVPVSASVLNGVAAGGYYSIAGEQIVSEPERNDATKVHLILLNTSDASARLVLTENTAEVISETASGHAQSRGVNPVKANLSVVSGTKTLKSFDLTLRRGQNLTFVVTDKTARLIENGFAPVADLD